MVTLITEPEISQLENKTIGLYFGNLIERTTFKNGKF